MKSAIVKKVCIALLVILPFSTLFLVTLGIRTPQDQILTACTANDITFDLTIVHHPPYHIVLGLLTPIEAGKVLNFSGELKITQSNVLVTAIRINSENVTRTLDLKGIDGYILTRDRTNKNERLESFLKKGQTYTIGVHFDHAPPSGSALWLRSRGSPYDYL